jgi:hypothetical protein
LSLEEFYERSLAQGCPEFLKTEAGALLHGTQGTAELCCDLSLSQPYEVREQQHATLLLGELSNRPEESAAALMRPGHLLEVGVGILGTRQELVDRVDDRGLSAAVPELIDDAVARDRHDPRRDRATGGIKLGRTLPDADKDVLRGLLCRPTPERVRRERIDISGVTVVESAERGEVAGGHPVDEGGIADRTLVPIPQAVSLPPRSPGSLFALTPPVAVELDEPTSLQSSLYPAEARALI